MQNKDKTQKLLNKGAKVCLKLLMKNSKKLQGAFFAGLNVFKLKLTTVSKRPYI